MRGAQTLPGLSPAALVDAVTAIAADDRRGQLGMLAQLLRPLLQPRAGAHTEPQRQEPAPAPHQPPAARSSDAEGADGASREALQQLNRLLQGALARVQLHQLDSAVTRQPATPETPPPAPAWIAELPIQTGRGFDQLQLRIEQREPHGEAARDRVWQVQLDFDLHELGRFSATLQLRGKQVAATLWSEKAETHRKVRAAIDDLRTKLRKAGVAVQEMQCRLGLPAPLPPAHQPLVDIRT